jgi:hypothetical protein
MKTIRDVEAQVEEKVTGSLKELDLLPQGYRCSVRLHGKSRDKRSTASFENSWCPGTDTIIIRFEATSDQAEARLQTLPPGARTTPRNPATKSDAAASDPLSDLIRALDHAESQPGYAFVALKWFRDTVLPLEGFSWASADSARRTVLRDAIDKRWILTSKVPNPKSPQFPVTAIRLNRLMPEVKAILGNAADRALDFHPVPIRGEDLSVTIGRDRR